MKHPQQLRLAKGVWARVRRHHPGRLAVLVAVLMAVSVCMVISMIHSDNDYLRSSGGSSGRGGGNTPNTNTTHSNSTNTANTTSLRDAGHEWLPDWTGVEHTHRLSDRLLLAFLAATLLLAHRQRDRLRVPRRTAALLAAVYALRTATVAATRVPPASPTCRVRWRETSDVGAVLSLLSSHEQACTDSTYLWSGCWCNGCGLVY